MKAVKKSLKAVPSRPQKAAGKPSKAVQGPPVPKPPNQPQPEASGRPTGVSDGIKPIPQEDAENLNKLSEKIEKDQAIGQVKEAIEQQKQEEILNPPPPPSDDPIQWLTDDMADIGVDLIHAGVNRIVLYWGKKVTPYNPGQREKLRAMLCTQAGKINMPGILAKYMPYLEPFIVIGVVTSANLVSLESKKPAAAPGPEAAKAGETVTVATGQ